MTDERVIAKCGRGLTFREALREDHLLHWPEDRGITFYVDTTNGASTNTGLSPDQALDTITAALGKCVADRRDVIYVLDWVEDKGETWPLAMSVAGVSLIGSQREWGMTRGTGVFPTTSGSACIHVTASNCRIINLALQSGADDDCITFADRPGGGAVIGCMFASCKNAIGGGASMAASPAQQWVFADNFFSSSVKDHGIYVFDPAWVVIRNNIFHNVGGDVACFIDRAGMETVIDNRFALAKDADGAAITVGAVNAAAGLFDGNHAYKAITGMTNNPYRDLCVATPSCWLSNYKAGVITAPKTT